MIGQKLAFYNIDDEFQRFYIIFDKIEDHFADFSVYEVHTWPNGEGQLYLSGFIKWDGCSHITFPDKGYKHLCGKSDWRDHCKMMFDLYNFVTSKIKDYDKEIAE